MIEKGKGMEKGYTIENVLKDGIGFVRLVDNYGTDLRIVEAARLSYHSPSKGEEADKKLLFYLYKQRHTSPFEQCNITFNIKLPLFVQAQMIRHRTQKINQISARYTEMTDEFYIPKEWRKQDVANKQGSQKEDDWNKKNVSLMTEHLISRNEWFSTEIRLLSEYCYNRYKACLEYGLSREMARMVLPQNLYTQIYSCWDLHNLMHFFRLRLDDHAQFEIRVFAQAMFDIFKELFPWCAEAYNRFNWKLVDANE